VSTTIVPRPARPPRAAEQRIAAVRRFNRFYTQRIGVLRRRIYASPMSLTQVRVLYELAHRDRATASDLAQALDLDPGYLSRILQGFENARWIRRARSSTDARQSHVTITAAGRRAFAPLDRESHDQMAALLAPLRPDDAATLVRCMTAIERLLKPRAGPGDAPAVEGVAGTAAMPTPTGSAVTDATRDIVLRAHRPGDIGWVIERHGALYAQECGWDERFEALVAAIAARFIERFDPATERCWIAERDGERLGCVFLVRKSRTVAQLRLLLVEPSARGRGLGQRLVDECLAFARKAGYRRMMLWTNAGLDAARGIYESRGFRLTGEERHHSFGHHLTGQTFELAL
jgi:DNA-binding MarR family transcriptional regulator/GNAT superfamily N-acetyltransferase